MALLKFENVTVQYPIYDSGAMSLRNQVARLGTGGRLAKDSGSSVTVTALDNVSFELKSGDSVGLIGHNGAGKSTLLRTMAGIYQPTSGKITRQGRVSTVFDIGAGMELDLSGRMNVYRVGMLMGMHKEEIDELMPDIEQFTELGDYLNLPVRTYSSGMTMRLMFALSTSIKPEILLIDEMFGVGDESFQNKAKKRMERLISNSKIFVFASHDHVMVNNLCSQIFEVASGRLN
ncbi:ABC transporter ATP-binding protein [Chitinibacter bivalviorum]|uniref:ABC transporter ATP-binding protein n=1 Tax=Chitinibacter bivalviorum TaxID=2739434 RepID=A0A7H9BN64_9NEIS|nr:ABC transporter ATP-binding protein [Chitinibacter bivalviorum]QLG89658.1 ABC transporter ATP-binding protein [Chitinibacter bivalviorum]